MTPSARRIAATHRQGATMSTDRDIQPDALAQIDQWHASVVTEVDALRDRVAADTAADEPASEAVNAWLLCRGLQNGGNSREHLAALAALLLIRTLRERT